MTPWAWFIFAAAFWCVWAVFCRWILENPRGDAPTGFLYRLMQVYARSFHRMQVAGHQHVPRGRDVGPLIVVCNHTAGIDPLLVQAACDFEIRWMMAMDMMLPRFRAFWDWTGVIPVDRYGRDTASAREAIKYVRACGVLGVFPEGRIERPPRHLLPFLPGLGLIVHRTGARVLPALVEGTPHTDAAWGSLRVRGRARVTFFPIIDYAASGLDAAAITRDIRELYERWTGWPAHTPRPLGEPRGEPLGESPVTSRGA